MGLGSSARTVLALALAGLSVIGAATGCARFDDTTSTPFSAVPTETAADISPVDPNAGPATSTPPGPPQPPGPCVDPDPNVVATCMDTLGGLVVLPDATTALVAERRTGVILRVSPGTPPTEVARVPVDSSGDGGLLDIAISPSFGEDRLIYAYITTPTDNRVVRVTAGDAPKDVLTGIPRGPVANRGALEFAGKDLLVLTGDAGNPAAAAAPTSLSGKLLRVVDTGTGPTKPAPQVLLAGVGRAGDVCVDPTGTTWVTDAIAGEDRLQRVGPSGPAAAPAWTWPDRPGVAGCAAGPTTVAVAMTGQRAVSVLTVDQQTGAITGTPAVVAQDKYGRLNGAALAPDGVVWVSTVNKDGGAPTPTDDRVVRIPLPSGGGSAD